MKKNFSIAALALFIAGGALFVNAQKGGQYEKDSNPKANRDRGLVLLGEIKSALKREYYDLGFRGIDIDARFKTAEAQIKTEDMNWQIYRTIAQVLSELRDSHTAFVPPDRLFRVEYGFTTMLVGEKCYVTEVKKGSDAEAKGMQAGDEIVSFSNLSPGRTNYSKISYIIYSLDPQEELNLVIKALDGSTKQTVIRSKFISPEQRIAERKKRKTEEQFKAVSCTELSPELITCKVRTFEVEPEAFDKMMKVAGKYKKLLLDLRGNSGGYRDSLIHFLGYFFVDNVHAGNEISRGKTRQRIIDGKGENSFKGDLGVLIDSESASASELFARIVQIQKRGTIYGDNSAGAVMVARLYGLAIPLSRASVSAQTGMPYYTALVEISVADIIMSDGKGLEGVGVAPDISILPTSMHISKRWDPALSYSAIKLGHKLLPEDAGKLNFLIPKSEDQFDLDGAAADSK